MTRTISSLLRSRTIGISVLFSLFMLYGCSGSSSELTTSDTDESGGQIDDTALITEGNLLSGDVIDIYDAVFTERSADCGDYVNTFDANPVDIQNSITFDSDVIITATDTECTITSNSVPNHDFNDETAAFAGGTEGATISEIATVSTVTRTPSFAAAPTPMGDGLKDGIFLNGVRLNILSAGCYKPNSPDAGEDGNVGIGCSSDDPWLLDPLGTEARFGADLHNAHTQPGGLYHYHGGPNAMFDDNPGNDGSPVIGFAADGFPIYGSYFLDNATGQVRKALSGYTLREGSRGERSDTNPGGTYDGNYNADWEFTNSGDLDECNGMNVDGQYGYYVTDTYPWVIKCFQGTPHETFGGGDENQQGPDGPPPQQ